MNKTTRKFKLSYTSSFVTNTKPRTFNVNHSPVSTSETTSPIIEGTSSGKIVEGPPTVSIPRTLAALSY